MLVVGAILAAAAGAAYNTTAAIQKHEVVRASTPARRLLPALARRPWWLATLVLDLAAWTAQTAAMALAPLVLVVPLMALGAALLVVLGVGWLGERFGRGELLAVALIVAGSAMVALAAGRLTVARTPLAPATQLLVAGIALGAALVAMGGRTGIAYGTAAGCLYAATAVLSKEIGDRVADHGLRALPLFAASPTPWLLALFGAGALWLVQVGFQRANAASVTAALTALDSLGPILAGFLLYHERWPAGGDRVLLAVGAATAVAGLTVLSARREAAEPAPDLPSGEPPPAARGLRAPVRLSIMRGAERGAGGAGKVAAATGRPPGKEDSEEIPGVPNGKEDLVSDSGMDVADRTFEAVVLYWDGLAGDAEVAAALRGRVAALRSAGAEVAIVSRTPVEGEHAADTTRRVLADLRTHGIGPELVLAAGAPDGEARALAEARVTVVPVRPAPGPGSDPSALVGVLDEQLARRAARRVQGVDADPGWTVAVDGGDTRPRQVAETLLTVADGLLGTRGVREEDGAGPAPATVAAGVYDDRSETVPLLPGPGWTGLEVAAGAGRERRVLDLRSGVLWRERADDGAPLRTLRFSSLARPGVVALRAEGGPAVLRPGPALLPPGGEAGFEQGRLGDVTWARTRARRDGGITAAARQREGGGDRATVERIAAYVADPTGAPGPEEAAERLRAAEAVGFDQLLAEHRRAWAARWADAEVTIEGDPRSEQAVRFALFHLLANVADRGEAAVGARGLSGPAYAGHVFWDADVFVLPTLAATHPAAARAMLEYRVRRLPAARRIAADLGYAGARFPWESAADGNEVTPATTVDERGEVIEVHTGELEEHITADIAWAAHRYAEWTGDEGFLHGPGRPLLVEGARYWASRVRLDADGRAHIEGVIGPDEYHEDVDDNAYTNVMARWHLRRAADLVEREGGGATGETRSWRRLADALVDGYDPATGRHEQFTGFFQLEPLVISEIGPPPLAAPALLGRDRVRGAQVVKQADVLMLHLLVPDETPPGSLAPDLAFYDPRTSHGSSLSPAVHAALLARAGEPDRALELFELAARLDLDDLTGTSARGLHVATMGGVLQALTYGFLGLDPSGGALHLDPRLPRSWSAVELRVRFRGRRVRVRAGHDEVDVEVDGPLPLAPGGAPVRTVAPPGARLLRRGGTWQDPA